MATETIKLIKTATGTFANPAKYSFDEQVNKLIKEGWIPVFESYTISDTHQSIVLWKYY